jgi:putative membrane protein
MKLVTFTAGLFGIALTAWLLSRFGVQAILHLVAQGGWGILAAILFHTVQVLLSAGAWRTIAGPDRAALPLRDYVALRCVREGVNNLLPVAQVGGEVISARLLSRRGVGLRRAAAATICDLTIELLSQVAFTIIGLGLLLCLVKRSSVTDDLVESAGVALALGAVFLGSQCLGAVSIIERLLVRIAAHLGWTGVEGIRGLHGEIMGLYTAPGRALRAGACQLLGWSLGAVEVCLILHFMGHDRSLTTGFVIESVGQAAKSVGFAVPGALGVSEGGFVLIGSLFGLPPAVSIGLSLIKRLREIAWGLPALAGWQWMESHWQDKQVAQRQGLCP